MRRRMIALLAVALLMSMLSGASATADVETGDATLEATVADGVRALTVDVTNALVLFSGPRSGMDGTYDIGVTEEARNGTNPWRVKASISADFTGGTSGVVIPSSNVSISGRTPALGTYLIPTDATSVVLGTLGAEGDFSTDREVLVVEGQDSTVAYTTATPHDATGTLTLVIPDEAPSDIYTGTLTFDLLNA